MPDTDWHMERLYAFAERSGASILVATHSRYVVDLNRRPMAPACTPGRASTGLCPVDTFDDTPIYAAGDVPTMQRSLRAANAIWVPYHAQLRAELDRIRATRYGGAVGCALHPFGAAIRFLKQSCPT